MAANGQKACGFSMPKLVPSLFFSKKDQAPLFMIKQQELHITIYNSADISWILSH